jgi:branched-subunit amino acid ABC-type transport system permease component
MTTLTTVLTNGVVSGAIYGLVAVGLALVYKKSGVLHFANAEIGMVGAFIFYALSVEQDVHYVLAAAAGIIVAAVLGAVTYLVLAPRRDDPLTMLIGTLAVGGILVFIAVEIWGANPRFVPPPLTGVTVDVLGFRVIGPRLLVLVVAVLLGIGAWAVFRYTNAGLVFRASAADAYAAQLMGVNALAVDVATWAAAGALAALAGILVAPLVGFHVFFMTLLAIRGFTATLLAGVGSVGGSLLAGIGIGVGESTLTRVTTEPGLPEAVLFVLIVGVLVFRPVQLGRRTA